LVFGKKPAKEFVDLQTLYPSLYRKVSEKLTALWVEEAFFGTGFFHADLHQGNILALYTDQEIRIQILDYGMVGRLSPALQNSILLLTVGVQTGNAKLIASSLSNLSKNPLGDVDFRRLLAKITERLGGIKTAAQSSLIDNSIEGWTAWALSENIEFNYEFLKLNRALQAIKSLLQDSGSRLSFQDIAKEVTFKYKARFSKMVFLERHLGPKDYGILIKEFFPQKPETEKNPSSTAKALRCENLFL
jgi:ubiquinone biosynthesis protein